MIPLRLSWARRCLVWALRTPDVESRSCVHSQVSNHVSMGSPVQEGAHGLGLLERAVLQDPVFRSVSMSSLSTILVYSAVLVRVKVESFRGHQGCSERRCCCCGERRRCCAGSICWVEMESRGCGNSLACSLGALRIGRVQDGGVTAGQLGRTSNVGSCAAQEGSEGGRPKRWKQRLDWELGPAGGSGGWIGSKKTVAEMGQGPGDQLVPPASRLSIKISGISLGLPLYVHGNDSGYNARILRVVPFDTGMRLALCDCLLVLR